MVQRDVQASIQLVNYNPILSENEDARIQYYMYLKKIIKLAHWDNRKYTWAQLEFYKKKLCGEQDLVPYIKNRRFERNFCYLLPFDIAVMVAYNEKILYSCKLPLIIEKIKADFRLPESAMEVLKKEFDVALGLDDDVWEELFENEVLRRFKEYLNVVRCNMRFLKTRPYNIMITATMSAGKSTLLNAMVGKNISLMQNMACTSKIHTIVSKMDDDGATNEYDHNMSLDASKDDLLSDNCDNLTNQIIVGTFLNSELGGKRVILFDSPGVNSSENIEHMKITHNMIFSRKYRLLLYVLNSTQLATTDDDYHLEVVAKALGWRKVLFVMNQIDHLISEEEDVYQIIERQRQFLISKGFEDPIVCPVSARAAYLARKSIAEGLSRIETREMYLYMDKFEIASMADYYIEQFNYPAFEYINDETQLLLRNCGMLYLEGIINHLYNGGDINGTGIC